MSWTYVVVWIIALLATLPLAPSILQAVEQATGKWITAVAVFALSGLFLVAIVSRMKRTGKTAIADLTVPVAAAALVIGSTIISTTPAEGLHFFQYGVLGALTFRAMSHRTQNVGIYIGAAILGGIVGTIDEAIQWVLPNRYWDIRDIAFNFSGAVLAQIVIAATLRPAYVRFRPTRSTVIRLSRLALVAVVLFGGSLLNTPQRIDWYTEKVPVLAALLRNATVMAEYGFLYADPEIGRFRSRLSADDLRQGDVALGSKLGPELELLRAADGYRQFLDLHQVLANPFAYEAAVHLARRDQHTRRASEIETAAAAEITPSLRNERRHAYTTAYRENEILERYFAVTLQQSTFRWSDPEKQAFAQKNDPRTRFESTVGKHLFTVITEKTVVLMTAFLLAALIALDLVTWRANARQQ